MHVHAHMLFDIGRGSHSDLEVWEHFGVRADSSMCRHGCRASISLGACLIDGMHAHMGRHILSQS